MRVGPGHAGTQLSISDVGQASDFPRSWASMHSEPTCARNTGQATVELSPFKNIVGIDPSAGMVDAARHALASSSDAVSGRIAYVQSPAERLTFLSEGSVDLMISGTSGSLWI